MGELVKGSGIPHSVPNFDPCYELSTEFSEGMGGGPCWTLRWPNGVRAQFTAGAMNIWSALAFLAGHRERETP